MSACAPSSPPALEARLTRAWLSRGPLACSLWPLSLLFRGLSGVRAALYRAGVLTAGRLPVPVVVVGNIFIGGTGKTPLTIWLVQALQAAGMRPGVISRGHGSKDTAPRLVDAAATPALVGDEPLLIWQRCACPVMVGRDRAATGQALLALHPELDIILTDDGLQHYALQRDVEIILFDGRGAGNGWLLPAGPLREPVSRRRDFTVINAPQLTPALLANVGASPRSAVAAQHMEAAAPVAHGASMPNMPNMPNMPRQPSAHADTFQMTLAGEFAEQLCNRQQRRSLAALATEQAARPTLRLVAAAGIGNPGRFFAMLKAAGLRVQELPLPDHHDFLDRPFAALDADLILMTEKDAVKCAQIEELRDDPRLWVVPVTARIDAALAAHIVEKCRGRTFA